MIFGSDGLEGCQHAVFEILSNAIDEAREGFGDLIILTCYEDKSIEVEDFGRGCPVDFNPVEQCYNWELVFCELYAGAKYKTNEGENYEYSLIKRSGLLCDPVFIGVYGCNRLRDGKNTACILKRAKISEG